MMMMMTTTKLMMLILATMTALIMQAMTLTRYPRVETRAKGLLFTTAFVIVAVVSATCNRPWSSCRRVGDSSHASQRWPTRVFGRHPTLGGATGIRGP